MTDDTNRVLEAVAALRAARASVTPIGEEMERWQICDLIFSDADVLRLAESRALVEAL